MSWRDHTWEFVIGAISWIIAIVALAGVITFVTFNAIRTRRREGRS